MGRTHGHRGSAGSFSASPSANPAGRRRGFGFASKGRRIHKNAQSPARGLRVDGNWGWLRRVRSLRPYERQRRGPPPGYRQPKAKPSVEPLDELLLVRALERHEELAVRALEALVAGGRSVEERSRELLVAVRALDLVDGLAGRRLGHSTESTKRRRVRRPVTCVASAPWTRTLFVAASPSSSAPSR